MYSRELTVRYSEIGPEGYADIAQVMDWFQDIATDHSEAAGFGAEVLKKLGIAWLVLHWDVQIHSFVGYNTRIVVETEATGFSSAYGHRMFWLRDMDGNLLASGESVWALYDVVKNRFSKASEEMCAAYGCSEKMPSEVLKKWKLGVPEENIKTVPIAVRRSDTDTNQHTNNVSYVRFLTDSLENGGAIQKVRVSYKKALLLGEQARLVLGDGNGAVLRDDAVCTLFEFE